MPLGFTEIEYTIRNKEGESWRVTGVQIGRWAVRLGAEDHPNLFDSDVENQYVVDHINSGVGAMAFDNFEDAYAFADDLSRFSKSDTSSRSPKGVMKQVGPAVRKWALHVKNNGYMPFREWIETQGESWSPRGRRWRKV